MVVVVVVDVVAVVDFRRFGLRSFRPPGAVCRPWDPQKQIRDLGNGAAVKVMGGRRKRHHEDEDQEEERGSRGWSFCVGLDPFSGL